MAKKPKKWFYHMVLADPEYKDHALALGLMLGHWGELETRLMRMTEFLFQAQGDLVNHFKTDFVYKEFINLPSKLTLLERITRWFIQDVSLKDEVNKLLKRVRNLNGTRNNYVHARWISYAGAGETSNKLIRISLGSPRNINELYNPTKHVTPNDIRDFVARIVKLSQDFDELLDRVFPISSK